MSFSFLRSYLTHPRTPSHPIGPLMRYLRWQYSARVLGQPLQFPFVNNTILEARRGWHAVTACYYFGLPEWEAMAFVGHVLRPPELFCDIGAHAGSYTVLAASVGAQIVTVEPSRLAMQCLSHHITINEIEDRVRTVEAALGAESGLIALIDAGQQTHVTPDSEEGDYSVDVLTLDHVLDGTCPVVMKIDVEGYEGKVLAGGQRTLQDQRLKAICIETMGLSKRYGDSDGAVLEPLYRQGFQRVDYNPVERQISLSDKQKGLSLLVRDMDWVRERVRSAPRLRLADGDV